MPLLVFALSNKLIRSLIVVSVLLSARDDRVSVRNSLRQFLLRRWRSDHAQQGRLRLQWKPTTGLVTRAVVQHISSQAYVIPLYIIIILCFPLTVQFCSCAFVTHRFFFELDLQIHVLFFFALEFTTWRNYSVLLCLIKWTCGIDLNRWTGALSVNTIKTLFHRHVLLVCLSNIHPTLVFLQALLHQIKMWCCSQLVEQLPWNGVHGLNIISPKLVATLGRLVPLILRLYKCETIILIRVHWIALHLWMLEICCLLVALSYR